MSLEQVTQEIIDAHNIRPNIRDDKPDAYHIFFQVGHLTIGYKRFLPREGIPQDVSTLIEKGNESQLREYFEHGPYGEILTVAAIPHIEVTATAYVLQGEIPFAQDITLTVTSTEVKKYMNRLQESGNPISQAFCTADKGVRIEDAQDKKHTFRVKYPFTDNSLIEFLEDLMWSKKMKQKESTPYPLQRIYEQLNNQVYCIYTQNGEYPIVDEDANIVHLHPRELLIVGRESPREQVMIAYFGEDEPTRIRYLGEDAQAMKKTVQKMCLPERWSDNLGERTFVRFSWNLQEMAGPVSLEQMLLSGKEQHFKHILYKLIAVYQEQDKNSYAAANATLSGEINS